MTHCCDLVIKQRCLWMWEEREGVRHLSYVFTPWASVSPGAPHWVPGVTMHSSGLIHPVGRKTLPDHWCRPAVEKRPEQDTSGDDSQSMTTSEGKHRNWVTAVVQTAGPLPLTLAVLFAAQSTLPQDPSHTPILCLQIPSQP